MRCARCRAKQFLPLHDARVRLRGRAAADRRRPDHLAALHRRLHDRGAGAEGRRARAGDRHRLGLRGGGARARSRGEVYTVERLGQLAEKAAQHARRSRLRATCTCCTATARWAGRSTRRTTPSSSPPAGPKIPRSLKEQLKIGGRLVIPGRPRAERAGARAGHAHRPRTSTGARTSPTSASCR